MGGVVGALLCYYCRSGCQASVVVSLLAFHPPDPSYDVIKNQETGEYEFVLFEEISRKELLENYSADMVVTSSKTSIPVLCFRCPGAKFTIIYSHGNATDIGGMFVMFAIMALTLKVNIVGYDYTGYGTSKGSGVKPTEKQTYRDIERVYDWCLETKLVTDPQTQVILYGQSVGSGPSCYLATQRPIAGLVLHSAIMSGIRVLTPSRALCCFDIYPNIDRIRRVRCPVFVIHGEDDQDVGFHHGQSLHGAVPTSYQTTPWWVQKRGHNNVLQGNERTYFSRLSAFISGLDKERSQQFSAATPTSLN